MMTSSADGALPPPGVTPNFDHPKDVLHTINLVTGTLTIALMSPFVFIRMYIKFCIKRSIEREDWFCVISWVLAIGYCLTGIMMSRHGGGNHEYEVTADNFVGFKKALYANSLVYGPTALFTKATLLLIYVRIFYLYKKTHIFIYGFIGVMTSYYFPVLIIKIQICKPISGFWNPKIHSTCMDQNFMFHTDTVMSALTDLIVLILPIPLVCGLQVPVKKKIKAICLLGAGGVATGASIVRLFLVFQPNSFADETVSFVRFNLLAVAEIGIGIICACLPAFGILFHRWSSEYASQQSRYNHIKLDRLNTRRAENGEIEGIHTSSQTRLSYLKVDSTRSIIGEQENIGGAASINDCSFLDQPTNFPRAMQQGKDFSLETIEVERRL